MLRKQNSGFQDLERRRNGGIIVQWVWSFSLGLTEAKVVEIDGSDGPNSINVFNANEMYMLK